MWTYVTVCKVIIYIFFSKCDKMISNSNYWPLTSIEFFYAKAMTELLISNTFQNKTVGENHHGSTGAGSWKMNLLNKNKNEEADPQHFPEL